MSVYAKQVTQGRLRDQCCKYEILACQRHLLDLKRQGTDAFPYDGHNATDLAIQMREDRNREDFCVEVSQTCAGQNLAVKTFRELLLQGKVVIEESPLVLWCLQNAIEIQNNYGDIKLSKRHKDDTERIDPLAANMNALARLLVREKPKPDLAEAMKRRNYHL